MTIISQITLSILFYFIFVNPWLIHVNVWQKPLQYCKVISLQIIKINGKKKTNGNIKLKGKKKKIKHFKTVSTIRWSMEAWCRVILKSTLKHLTLLKSHWTVPSLLAFVCHRLILKWTSKLITHCFSHLEGRNVTNAQNFSQLKKYAFIIYGNHNTLCSKHNTLCLKS